MPLEEVFSTSESSEVSALTFLTIFYGLSLIGEFLVTQYFLYRLMAEVELVRLLFKVATILRF